MDQKEKEEETVQEQKVQDGKAQEKNGTEEPKDWNSRREHRDQKEAGEKEAREDQEDMSITIKKFVRFETGEGMEKKEENFAEEVAKQMGK